MATESEKHGRYTIHTEDYSEDHYRCYIEVSYPKGYTYHWGSKEDPPDCYGQGSVEHYTAGYASTRAEAFELGRRWIVLQQKKPFTVEWKMQYSFRAYPGISPTRWSVLDHLFFTLGNGIEWLDGQLVPRDVSLIAMEDVVEGSRQLREEYVRHEAAMREHDEREGNKVSSMIEKTLETWCNLERLWWRPSTIAGIPDDDTLIQHVKDTSERYYGIGLSSWYDTQPRPLPLPDGWLRVYPFSKPCNIWMMPDDVEDDWLSAGWEALHLAATRGSEASIRLKCRECASYLWGRFGERLVLMGEVPWHINLPVDDGKDHDYMSTQDYYIEKQAASRCEQRVEAYRKYLAKMRANPESEGEYIPMDATL